MSMEIRPLSPVLGAEVLGIDLRTTLDDAVANEIREAWRRHQVLLFRGQDISVDDQRRFVGIFGEIQPPRTRVSERLHPDVMYVANVTVDGERGDLPEGEMQFHADQCYYETPTRGAVLYALEIPSQGGNTLFSSTYRAYESLPREPRSASRACRGCSPTTPTATPTSARRSARTRRASCIRS